MGSKPTSHPYFYSDYFNMYRSLNHDYKIATIISCS